MMKRILCLLLLIHILGYPARAYEYILLYDTTGSAVTGAVGLVSLHGAAGTLEDRAVPLSFGNEATWYGKTVHVIYRAAKTVLFDLVADHMTLLIQHEVFGHGSRCRELGYTGTSYSFSPFFPYGDASGYTRFGTPPDTGISLHQALLRTIAGNESARIMAHELIRRWMSTGRMNYREATLYLLGSNNLAWYILSTALGNDESSNDILQYLTTINQLYGPDVGGLIPPGIGEEALDLDDLTWNCLLTAADPFQYFALASYLYGYLWAGKTEVRTPMFGGPGWSYIPLVRFGLTPFGVEYYLDQYANLSGWLLRAYIRIGNPVFEPHFGGGVDGETPWLYDVVRLRIAIHAWSQPGFSTGNAPETLHRAGIGAAFAAGIKVRFPRTPILAAVQGRYKTTGYLEGEPVEAGWDLRLGVGYEY